METFSSFFSVSNMKIPLRRVMNQAATDVDVKEKRKQGNSGRIPIGYPCVIISRLDRLICCLFAHVFLLWRMTHYSEGLLID